jgi:hypothetical protein
MAVLSISGSIQLQQGELEVSQVIPGQRLAGEALTALAPCYIASDETVMMSGGSGITAVGDAGGVVIGYTLRAYALGDPVTLVRNAAVSMSGASFTPGQKYWLDTSAATKGRLNTTVPTAFSQPVLAVAIDTKTLLLGNSYLGIFTYDAP